MKPTPTHSPLLTSGALYALWWLVWSQAASAARNPYGRVMQVPVPSLHLPGYNMQPYIQLPLEHSRFHSGRVRNAAHKVSRGARYLGSRVKNRFGSSRPRQVYLNNQYWGQEAEPYSVQQAGYNYDYSSGGLATSHYDVGMHLRDTPLHSYGAQQISSSLIGELQMKVSLMREQLDSMSDLLASLAGGAATYSGNYQSSIQPSFEVSVTRSSAGPANDSKQLSETIEAEADVSQTPLASEMREEKQKEQEQAVREVGDQLVPEEPAPEKPEAMSVEVERAVEAAASTKVPQDQIPNMSGQKHGQQESYKRHHKKGRLRRLAEKAMSFSAEREARPSSADTSASQLSVIQSPTSSAPIRQPTVQQPESLQQQQQSDRAAKRGRGSRKMRRMANKIRSYKSTPRSHDMGFRLESVLPDMLGSYPIVPQV